MKTCPKCRSTNIEITLQRQACCHDCAHEWTARTKYDRYTIQPARPPLDGFNVYGWSTYAKSSVLAGQAMKVFIENYPTHEMAAQAYPSAHDSHPFLEPRPYLAHLPGEDDPVAGGMYPDDIGDDHGR